MAQTYQLPDELLELRSAALCRRYACRVAEVEGRQRAVPRLRLGRWLPLFDLARRLGVAARMIQRERDHFTTRRTVPGRPREVEIDERVRLWCARNRVAVTFTPSA